MDDVHSMLVEYFPSSGNSGWLEVRGKITPKGGGAVKKLPIGVENFEEMIKEGYYYVDKTMLIKEIVDFSGKVKLITRPRRFGKTLNMDMLRRFFSMEEKENLFEDLNIWNEKGIIKEYYHEFPVVFVSFKGVKKADWESAVLVLKEILSDVVLKYLDLDVREELKRKMRSVANKDADMGTYEGIIHTMMRSIYETTGKRTVVLIDEYDVPIESAYTYRHRDPDYYDNMVSFMRGLLTGALKDNPYLEFAVLTGVYRVAKESIFSGLNNLAVYTVFENEMSDKFGFTEEEISKMLRSYGLSEKDKRVVDEWYGGYRMGDHILYNPWSVIYYVKSRVEGRKDVEEATQPYWINTSSNDLIKEQVERNPELKREMDSLLEGKEVLTSLNPHLSLRELEEDPSGVWTLLANGGYVSVKVERLGLYSVKLPNEEIRNFFKEVVSSWITRSMNMSRSEFYKSLVMMLSAGEYERFKEELEGFVLNSFSFYDLGGKETERVYKAFLMGILSMATNGYVVESELESGYGRLDVVLYPRDGSYGEYAVIFEVKRADEGEDLEELAEKALEQISGKKYHTKMRRLGYRVIGFGIAFPGKKVKINAKEIS